MANQANRIQVKGLSFCMVSAIENYDKNCNDSISVNQCFDFANDSDMRVIWQPLSGIAKLLRGEEHFILKKSRKPLFSGKINQKSVKSLSC